MARTNLLDRIRDQNTARRNRRRRTARGVVGHSKVLGVAGGILKPRQKGAKAVTGTMNAFFADVFSQVAAVAQRLATASKKKTVSTKEVQLALNIVLGDKYPHAELPQRQHQHQEGEADGH